MEVGLYFGSFNPIHVGHLIIANHMKEYSKLDEVWFVVSPHSPFKEKKSLLNDYHRLDIVHKALYNYPKLRVSDIEFHLPQPNYTSRTLVELKEKHPKHKFSLIMGEDNLATLHKWKNHEYILDNHEIFVYPRPGYNKPDTLKNKKVHLVEAPLMEISASAIRKGIRDGKYLRPLLPEGIWDYLEEQNFYR